MRKNLAGVCQEPSRPLLIDFGDLSTKIDSDEEETTPRPNPTFILCQWPNKKGRTHKKHVAVTLKFAKHLSAGDDFVAPVFEARRLFPAKSLRDLNSEVRTSV